MHGRGATLSVPLTLDYFRVIQDLVFRSFSAALALLSLGQGCQSSPRLRSIRLSPAR